MKKLASLALLSYCVTVLAPAQESGWPREIETSQGTVTIYQPQIEDFTGDKLEARAAVSVTPKGGAPVFGAVWISARVETDRDTRTVSVRSIEVPQVKFAHASDEDQQKLAEFLKKEIATWNLTFSVDDLLTSLEAQGIQGTQGLRHDPPRILYSQEPAILVRIDGEPKLEKLRGHESTEGDQYALCPGSRQARHLLPVRRWGSLVLLLARFWKAGRWLPRFPGKWLNWCPKMKNSRTTQPA